MRYLKLVILVLANALISPASIGDQDGLDEKVPFRDCQGVGMCDENHRRHAMSLASQLPEGLDDALAVLDCVRELVVRFLQSNTPEPEKAPVVTLARSRPDLSA
jgi:hypothetical protein